MYFDKLLVWTLKVILIFSVIVSCAPETNIEIKESIKPKHNSIETKPIEIKYNDTIVEYKLRDEKQHTIKIDCSKIDKSEIDSLILAIYSFNKEYYARNKYLVASSQLFQSKTDKLVTISGFKNKIDVMEYYHNLTTKVKFAIDVEDINRSLYVIHNYNSMLLMKSKSLVGYTDFFIEKYIKNNTDTLRNDFDETQLYSDNDTLNFYVCIKSENRKELDKKSVKSLITDYNNMHFPDLELNIHSIPIKSSINVDLFTITDFTNKFEAIEYKDHVISKYSDIKNDIFVISQNNYFTMLFEESINDYMIFYASKFEH